MNPVTVAVADIHGNATLFDTLLTRLDADLGATYRLVTLGDYVDNGPEIPALLERLIELREQRGDRFTPIIGNHDLACLRAMGWQGDAPDESWYKAWRQKYWNAGGSTAEAYGARSGAALALQMPPAHRAFLQSLPWFHDDGEHLFVHAGLEAGPIAPQLEALARHELLPNQHTIPPLREKNLSVVSDPSWDRVVVSGHTKVPADRVPGHRHAPHFVTDRRITLSAEVDRTGTLFAVALPARVIYAVHASNPSHVRTSSVA